MESRLFVVNGHAYTIQQDLSRPEADPELKSPKEDLSHVGLIVWHAAFVLADYLTRVRPLGAWADLKVLELGTFPTIIHPYIIHPVQYRYTCWQNDDACIACAGAGTGLTGIVLAREGADVVSTDLGGNIVDLLQRNVDSNVPGARIRVASYAWGDPIDALQFPPDVVIGADVMYEREHFPSLIKTLRDVSLANLAAGKAPPAVYLAYKLRGRGEREFVRLLNSSGFRITRTPRESLHEQFADGQHQIVRADWVGS